MIYADRVTRARFGSVWWIACALAASACGDEPPEDRAGASSTTGAAGSGGSGGSDYDPLACDRSCSQPSDCAAVPKDESTCCSCEFVAVSAAAKDACTATYTPCEGVACAPCPGPVFDCVGGECRP